MVNQTDLYRDVTLKGLKQKIENMESNWRSRNSEPSSYADIGISGSNISDSNKSTVIDSNEGMVEGIDEGEARLQETLSVDIQKRIQWTAMELLSRREHSRKELLNKLLSRYPDQQSSIYGCVTDLTDKGLQSDKRYCEDYVAMRKRKGCGPYRILSELREKGVCERLAVSGVYDSKNDWFSMAWSAWNKKFDGVLPSDSKSKAKQIRFLTYRGFSSEQVQEVLSD